MPSGIEQWINRDFQNKDMEDLAIILNQIVLYLDALDARLTAGGL